MSKVLNESDIEVFGRFKGKDGFNGCYYVNPMFPDSAHPMYAAATVQANKGTGIVHCSFAHGFDDFNIAIANGEHVECYVDEEGRYTRDVGPRLYRKSVLEDGSSLVQQMFKQSVLLVEKVPMSISVDWRTKLPTIVRTSQQWFINIAAIRDEALALLTKHVTTTEGGRSAMKAYLAGRDDWCISRQRVWGLPIPALYALDPNHHGTANQYDSKPLISQAFVHNVAELFRLHGSDCWWQLPLDQLCPKQIGDDLRDSASLPPSTELVRGSDVMDVWFDSGAAFACYGDGGGSEIGLGETPNIDLVVEGMDQFRGWFRSSLLLATAAYGVAPFKTLHYHGFALDDKGEKMSKSKGNVVDPVQIVKSSGEGFEKLGIDYLRLWTCRYALSDNIRIGAAVMNGLRDDMRRIRLTIRLCHGIFANLDPRSFLIDYYEQLLLDRYMLLQLHKLVTESNDAYRLYKLDALAKNAVDFANGTFAAFYFAPLKDRLYCDSVNSLNRRSALTTLHYVYRHLLNILLPVMPHLVVEATTDNNGEDPLRQQWMHPNPLWHDSDIASLFEQLLPIRRRYQQMMTKSDPNGALNLVTITATKHLFEKASRLQPTTTDTESELCEFLHAPLVTLLRSEANGDVEVGGDDDSGFRISVDKSPLEMCLRCRRYCRTSDSPHDDLCLRCYHCLVDINYAAFK